MIHAERLRTFYLFTAIAACCLLIVGCPQPECTVDCPQPEDVDCTDLSASVTEETIICTDGNEPQVCMAPDSDNCGYYVNSMYMPCSSCNDCDAATDVAVTVCLGMSLSVDFSLTDQMADESIVENTEVFRDAMEDRKESY